MKGNPLLLVGFWLLWTYATVQVVTDDIISATYTLGLAILFRLFWQESRHG